MKIYVVKQLNHSLVASHPSDLDKLKKIKTGDTVEVEVKKPRNLKFHRKFWALINLVYDNQEIYRNIDHLKRDLLIEAGLYEERVNLHGEVLKEPCSISFANMDEYQFEEVYNKVLDVIVTNFHFDKEDIQANIESFY